MNLEQALEELKKYCNNLSMIKDIKNNKQEFLSNFMKVSQMYHYIEKNNQEEIFFEAVNVLCDMEIKNPLLEEYINIILKSNTQKKNEQIQRSSKSNQLKQKIETLIRDIEKSNYSYESLDDIEWALITVKEELLELKREYSIEEFNRLLTMIETKEKNIDILVEKEQTINSSYNL